MKKLESKEIKEIEHGILKYVAEVCDRNNLRYFLSYGTLLGAIRHKGFIPWDDDIDIAMPRQDYDKLLKILRSSSDSKYKVLIPGEADYFYEFAKVVDTDTEVKELGLEESERALWIDIFPLDGLIKEDKLQTRFLKILHFFRVAAVYKSMPPSPGWAKVPLFLFWKICRLIGWRYFLKLVINLSQKYKYEDCDYVGYAASYPGKNKFIPKQFFSEVVEVSFEGKVYKAPKMWDAYLTMLYGDYMTLPDEDKRIGHKILAYKKG